jgi:hypothetical protein
VSGLLEEDFMSVKRLVVVFGIVAVLIATPAIAAVSRQTNEQSGGCAPGVGWTLWSVTDLLDFIGLTEVPPSMDGNEDGLTCVRLQTLANGRKGWIGVTYVDNNVR